MKKKNVVDKITIIMIIMAITIVATLIIGILMVISINKKKPVEVELVVKAPAKQIEYEKIIEVREEAQEFTEIQLWAIPVSEEDLELMSRVVMSEASTVPYIGKVAVASVIVNRVIDGRWGDTVHDVIYYEDAFSTADNGEVTDECRAAVIQALECSNAFPKDMFWFRSDHYHDFGYDYTPLGNLYFSTENQYQ